MKKLIFGLWVALLTLVLLPGVLSLDIETDKLSYRDGETISVFVSENSKIEYNGLIKNGRHAEFIAVKSDNEILVNDEYQKLIHVSDGKVVRTSLDLGIFGLINLLIVKIVKKCWKIFI